MKKKNYFWLSLIFSGALITGCGGINLPINEDDSSKTSSTSSSGSEGDETGLDNTKEEAQNKLKTLGSTSGYLITLEASGQNEETGAMETESVTMGYKGQVFWVVGEMALKQTPTGTETYSAVAGANNQYNFEAELDASIFDSSVNAFTEMFYISYQFNSYLKESGNTTYLGRSAKKYVFTGAFETAYANVEVIIDNETGITLKFFAQGQDVAGTSAMGSLVVTEFKTGDQVRLPELKKGDDGQGGSGGQGEGGETEKLPKAGKYSYDASRSRNPGIYADGYFEIDEEGNGTFVDYPNYLDEKHYYTGSFELSGNDIVLTTVFGILESNGRITNTTATGGATFTFTSLGDDSYGITLDGCYIVYKYGEGGSAQPVDLTKYKATAAQYAYYITDMSEIGSTGNLKFNVIYKVANIAFQSTTLHNNYGNYLDELVYLDNNQTIRILYAKVEGHEGYYDMYHWEDGGWKKSNGTYPVELSLFADKAALLKLSYIPFDKFSEPTDGNDPAYTCAKFDYENDQTGVSIHLTNIKLYFVDGVLTRYSYKSDSNDSYEVNISDRGRVNFDIPGGSQEPQEVKDNALLSGQNGAHFVFNRADLGGYTGTDLNSTIEALQDTSFNFFTNGNVEMIYANASLNVVTLGTYTLMKKEGNNQATARLAMTERYVNGVKNNELEFNPITLVQYYLIQQDELHIIETGTTALGEPIEVHIIFTRTTDVPTPYDPSAVTPPEESKWPADKIAKMLGELEINAKLPAATTPNEGIKAVELKAEAGSLVISITFNAYGTYTAADAAMLEFAQYMAALTDFTLNYSESNTTNGVYAFVAKDGKSMVKLHYVEGEASLKIVVSKYNANAYPAAKIQAYLTAHEIDVTIPSLQLDGVSYEFAEDYGMLLATPTAESLTPESILESFCGVLANAGFKHLCAYNENAVGHYYFDVELKCMIGFMIYDGRVAALISAYDENADNFLLYPKTALDDSYPAGIRDSYPSFEVEGAAYMFKDLGDSKYELDITIQQGQNISAVLRELKAKLTADFGYTLVDDKYVSANGEIKISITSMEDVLIVIEIEYFPPEEETVTYTFTDKSTFDARKDEAQLYAYVWDNKGDGYWVELQYDEEAQTFTIEVSSYIIGCKIVRFAPDSSIDWAAGPDGSVNQDVNIWNESGDIELPGESSALEFVLANRD